MTSSARVGFTPASSYDFSSLLDCAEGKLFGEGNPQLPKPPMLMFDEISHIDADGGNYAKGRIHAKLAIDIDKWFFGCHFHNDPVMPGCLGLDAMWQLVGFYLGWRGYRGYGRALGCGSVRFSGQVLPTAGIVEYEVHIKKIVNRSLTLGIGDATMGVDGEVIYNASDLRVGLFTNDSMR